MSGSSKKRGMGSDTRKTTSSATPQEMRKRGRSIACCGVLPLELAMKQNALNMHTIGRLVATALLAVTSAVAALLLVATAIATYEASVSNVIM